MKVRHPDTRTVHLVRDFRTEMMYGLECGKAGSRARMEPAGGYDVTCEMCSKHDMASAW